MFPIVSNDLIAPNLYRMVIRAPRIARSRQPGQFVIVHADQEAERIPLTIADADIDRGTVTLFVQAVGYSTCRLTALPAGTSLRDLAGPLGRPTEIKPWGRVACIGGGVGTAVLYPLAKALAEAGNQVISVIGGRNADLIILADELAEFCVEVLVATEDGSRGRQGFVTHVLQGLIADPRSIPQAVYAVGPVPMMKAVTEMTRPHQIRTIVSLNPIMIDGTGMCGGCRVVVGGELKFACVDGPEFDGHLVDFDLLADRLSTYRTEECKMIRKLPEQQRPEQRNQ
ncbi:ferredoxin-NADP reductase [Syntrophotalea acetylenivorans]|uniref:Ferredoxin-NADP reductase n=1 Tax=Syntrophotalea acetylenivorans TaxID=1842532 RepID=A0A1L3GP57_9BACT|nr:sulfide/dihydroorotate dehydrogenase-like FAD/NAD-binding protein [Syntrophotalea acetylenivorans]APG27719.1 ferredoxin-NADP reductase [Syntrophotalea acetylenivorans]